MKRCWLQTSGVLLMFWMMNGMVAMAQDASSVQWNLQSDSAATTISGNVLAPVEKLSYSAADSSLCLHIKDYNATGGGQRLNLGAKTWPNQSVIDTGRFVQFSIAPVSGYSLQVSSVSLTIGAGGTSSMNAAVYISTDSMFAGSTVLAAALSLPSGAWYDSTQTTYSVSVTIGDSQKFYVRIYPWYNNSNASISKYIYLRNVNIAGTSYSNSTTTVPTVTTKSVTSITSTSAVCGGTVLSDGNDSVTVRGVCWNTTGTPTISDSKTTDGADVGTFTSNITGLTKGGTYYVRAYATNALGTGYGELYSFVTQDSVLLLAFPGAEGFGAHVTGGRGGAVYEVTTLLDTTAEGSLRYAVNQSGARTIVFRVSGTIYLKSSLSITNGNLTIAGQTAPGDGICLAGYTPSIKCDNVIVRFLRFRLGDVNDIEDDAFNGRNHSNIMIDHCTMTWSVDECASFYDNTNFTMQWCIIGESLYHSVHEKGNHGYGGIEGGMGATFHHNLYIHNTSRNPRFCGARYHLGTASTEVVDFRNNVLYNWGFNSAYGGEHGNHNMINNYYKPGPATKTTSGVQYRIVQPSDTLTSKPLSKWYVQGNYMYGNSTVTANNWNGGVQIYDSNLPADSIKLLSPLPVDTVTTETAEQAYSSVLANAGVTVPKRDSLEERYIREATNGTATYGGCYANTSGDTVGTGIIDSQSKIGGWPVLESAAAPTDSDHDGMPDTWETSQGLNPYDASDRNTVNAEGYTYLEVYLHALVSGTTTSVTGLTQPTAFSLSQNYPNPFNPTTTIAYAIPQHSKVTLLVYDVLGRQIAMLVNEIKSAGTYFVSLDATKLSSGVYFYRLQSGSFVQTKKMVLLK
jgi:hypothetical protein